MEFLREKFLTEHSQNKTKYLVLKNATLKLSPDKATDLINESLKYPVVFGSLEGVLNNAMAGKLDYEWKPVYRPRVGQVFFTYHPLTSDTLRLPSDGYQWPSPVQTHKVKDIAAGKELQIFTQPDGSDGSTVLAKRVYHFAQSSGDPGFILIHYLTNDAVQQFLSPKAGQAGQRSQSKPGQPQPQQPYPQQQQQQQQQFAGAASGRLQGIKGQPGAVMQTPQAAVGPQLTPQQMQQQQAFQRHQQYSENLEAFVSEKQVALGRYSQNHEFLEELFNPISVGQIMEAMKAQSQAVIENKEIFEKLSKKRVDIEEDVVQMNKRHKEDMKSVEADAAKWSQHMKQLEACTTPEELDALGKKINEAAEIEYHDVEEPIRVVSLQ